MRIRPWRPAVLAAGPLAAAVLLTACQQAPVPGGTGSTTASPTPGTSTVPATTAPPTTAPPTTSAGPTTTAPATTSGGTTPPATSSAPASTSAAPGTSATSVPAANTCAGSALSVVVERGSGVAGHQYATVVFTNTGAASCNLSGFPTVALLTGGKTVGSSRQAPGSAATVTLAPHGSASSQLVNDSTCGADNSDSIRIGIPGSSTTVTKPLSFRACTVTVGAVTAGG